jgi:hypothetical protein
MGLFGGKKTYVSSTLYNLAGAEEDRINFLKTTLISHRIFNSGNYDTSLGTTVRNSYLRGPGLKMRSFFRWAEINYGPIGVPSGSLGGANNLDRAVIGGQIPVSPGQSVQVQVADVGRGDYSYWAEQWMFANYPLLVDTFWSSDINETTGVIRVTFEDMTFADFTPVGFNPENAYLYATYYETGAGYEDAVIVGTPVVLDPPTTEFPATTGWTMLSETITTETVNTRTIQVWEKTEYQGQDPDPNIDEVFSLKSTMTLNQLVDDSATPVVLERTYQIDTQRIVSIQNTSTQIYIYELGSGNVVLDGLVVAEADEGEYIPFIPIRLNNQFLSPTFNPAAYTLAKRAYKKASGGKYDKLVEQMTDNPDLAEIDYAYIMYGVALNVVDPTGKEYLYRYFDRLRTSQTTDNLEYIIWRDNKFSYDATTATYTAWRDAQLDILDPLYGTAQPPLPGLTTLGTKPSNRVEIKSSGTLNTNLDMTISWQYIERTTGTGLKKVGAKKDEYWLEKGGEVVTGNTTINGAGGTSIYVNRPGDDIFRIHHQIDLNSWETLTIVGAKHVNLIYDKKSVDITATEALDDLDESGFLVPLHYSTLRSMSLKDSTQLCTGCGYIVFNSYKIVKKKWYQTGIFKIFVFIVIIAITVATGGVGAGSVGLLGTAASVGAALGLTGLVAVIAGAVVNALAAMLLMKLIAIGSVALFGEKLGALIGTIVGFMAMATGTGLMNGQSMSAVWGSMTSAQNLMQLTSVLSAGISGYVQASAMQTYQKSADMEKAAGLEAKELNAKFVSEFGYGTGLINSTELVESFKQASFESSDDFITRTLLTGTDIAEMSIDMLNNFSNYTLTLKKV